ncbi:LPXTG-domain-containing protein cell wall anchor domain protein [Enterococcus casseliflavus]|nr:LPXTG-domain-containing protein cell wall anchor domain protein [Enterococcus casseliflavus]
MNKKFFSCISLATLLVPTIFDPIVYVKADVQQENVAQTTSEESENMNHSSTMLDSSITPSESSDTSTEENNESTESSSNNAESYSEDQGNSQVENETTSQSAADQSEVAVNNDQEELATWLPDPTLQSVVAKSLGIDVSEITKEQMNKLQTLYIYATDSAITDLTGLEYAINLSSFYMSGQNQITDFSVLLTLNNLVYVYLMGANVTDDNVPNFGDNITRLNLSSANVTDAVLSKIVNMKGLESLSFESNMNITTIAPLVALPNLTELRIQFCAVTDFTVINEFPKLSSLAAFGQNTGRNDAITSLSAKQLNYDSDNQSFFVPFSIMPNRLTNFDGYQPPFTTSNSTSQTYFDLNGVQLSSSRLSITEDGITVSEVTQNEFDSIETIKYNAFYNNPAGSYAQPDGYSFYAISSGTYLHQFSISHQEAAADVTVSYIDNEGNELKPSQKISGNIGESFDATTPKYKLEIDWYTLKEVRGNPVGTFSDAAQEVVYVYERSDAAPVTVKHQDSEGNQLADPTVLSGKVGLPYTSEAKKIPGWYVVETPDNASGTFSDAAQEVVYVYERSDAAPVTVKYQDSEGNQLADPTVLSGKVGLPYTSEAKEIPGWYVAQTPTNTSGTFSDTAQEVVYVYERSDAAPVTVKYQDSEGNQLADPTVLSGKVGLPYTSEANEIPGWYVVETPDNASGTFSVAAQEVVYVYERSDAAPVTVKYQDSEGNQLADPTVLSGKIGLPYESEAKEIPGWYVVETPDNVSGTFSDVAQEVVYVYERSDAAPVTVKYQDSEGNQLADPTVLSGKIGLPYESEAKEIPGWYVVETPDNASGTFSDAAQEVVYVYERSDAAPVTVKYQDSEGNQLADPTILSGKIGLPYESEAKEIPGWYVVETPDNASGTFSDAAEEVVYVYSTKSHNPKNNGNSNNYLPKTGEQIKGQLILSSVGVLLVTLVFVAFKKRKRSNR